MAFEFTSENFEKEALQSDVPVLVDFWAPWCGPCKMLGPVVEKVANDLEGTAKVGKLNVDDAADIASKYGVASIPTMILIKNGEEVARKTGFAPEPAIKAFIADN